MLELAQKYAELKGTTVIAHKEREDGSIVFVLASGPKLTMTRQELIDQLPVVEEPKPAKAKRAKKTK